MILSEKASLVCKFCLLKLNNYWFYPLFVSILFLKKNESFTNPQFWAEDSNVFFKDSIELGIHSLFIPYAGYLHLIQRIIAYIASKFSYEIIPHIYNYASLAVLLYTVWFCINQVDLFKNNKPIILLLALVPHSNEILVNLTNLHWYTSIYLGVLLLCDEKKFRGYFNLAFTVVCSFSGPFSVIILPFYIVKNLISGTIRSWSPFRYSIVAGALTQIIFLYNEKNAETTNLKINFISEVLSVLIARVFFMQKIDGDFFNFYKVYFIIIFLLLNLILIIFNKKKISLLLFYLYTVSIGILAAVKFKSQGIVDLLYIYPTSDRYFFSFNFAFLLLSIVPFVNYRRGIFTGIYIIFIFLYSLFTGTFFTHPHYRFVDYNWEEQASMLKEGNYQRLFVNPPGWFVDVNTSSE